MPFPFVGFIYLLVCYCTSSHLLLLFSPSLLLFLFFFPSKDIACFLADAYLQFWFPIFLPHLTHLTSMSRLIHLPLKRIGKNYFCLCMIHNDKFSSSTSFSFSSLCVLTVFSFSTVFYRESKHFSE